MLLALFTILLLALFLGMPAFASVLDEGDRKKIVADLLKGLKDSDLELEAEVEVHANYEDAIKSLGGYKAAVDAVNKALKEGVPEAQARAQAAKDSAEFGAGEQTLQEERLVMAKATAKLQKAQLKDAKALLEYAKSSGDEERVNQAGRLVEKMEALVASGKAHVKNQEKSVKASQRARDSLSGFITGFTGLASSFEETMLGSIVETAKGLGDLESWISTIGGTLADQLSPANMFASVLDKVVESTKMMIVAVDQAFASFEQSTGALESFSTVMLETRFVAAGSAIEFGALAEAETTLATTMRRFTEATMQNRADLVLHTAQMERLGVSSAATAQFMNTMTSALRMTEAQSRETEREIAAVAGAIGITATEAVESFNAAASQLAAHGTNMVDVFSGVATAAAVTGASVSELMGVVGQAMDTFDGAAEAAGRMNAILGDDLLNSVDLLNASEDERIRMMIESIALSGRSWDAMGRFEKRALATAAGIQDMTLANQLFGQSLAEYDEYQSRTVAATMSQEELAERARESATIFDKLKVIVQSFAIALGDIINAVHWLLNGVLAINEAWGGAFVPILFGVIGVIWMLVKVVKTMIFLDKIWAAWTAILTARGYTQAAANEIVALSFLNIGKAMLKAMGIVALIVAAFVFFQATGVDLKWTLGIITTGLIAMGVATKFAGGWWGLLAFAVAAVVGWFMAPKHSPPFYIALFIIAAGLLAVGFATQFAAGPMIAFGFGVMLAGAGIALLGLGAKMAGEGMAKMFESLALVSPLQLIAMAGAMVLLGYAMMFLGGAFLMPFTVIGLLVLTRMLNEISKLSNVEVTLKATAVGLKEMAEAITGIPIIKSLVLAATMGKLADFSTDATPENVESARKMTGVIKEIADIKIGLTSAIMFDKAVDNIVKVLASATGGGGGTPAPAPPSPTTVVLELDRRQFGKTVVELVNEKYDLKSRTR